MQHIETYTQVKNKPMKNISTYVLLSESTETAQRFYFIHDTQHYMCVIGQLYNAWKYLFVMLLTV